MNTSAPATAAATPSSIDVDSTMPSTPSGMRGSNEGVSEKNFSPLVKNFLDYLKLEKHFSDYTIKSYGADLIQFGQFLSGEIGASHAVQPRPGNTLDEKQVAVEPLTVREFLA